MVEEKTISSRYVFKGRAFNVRVDTVINAEGHETTREIVEHAECIAVVPVDANGDILLVRQYRKAIEKELLEIPAGGIEPGEDPDTAVKTRATGRDRPHSGQSGEDGRILFFAGILHRIPLPVPGNRPSNPASFMLRIRPV